MSFLSKGLPEGALPGFRVRGGGGWVGGGWCSRAWEHNIFKALEKPKREAVVLRGCIINTTDWLLKA